MAGVLQPESEPAPSPQSRGAVGEAVSRLRSAAAGASPEAERVRLFVNAPGGVPAPPYGSWWLEETLQGRSTEEVAAFYRQEGLQSSGGAGPADYLPAELEFLHFLLQHQRAARVTRSESLEQQGRESERQFLERFLLPWLPAFCSGARQATADPFWLSVFDLLEAFIAGEVEATGAGTCKLT
jgi:TorA maturation chaperone TorD